MTVLRPIVSIASWLLLLPSAQAMSATTLLAQGEGASSKYAVSWGVIVLTLVLGIWITVKSSHRKMEFKRHGIKWDKD